MDLARLVGGPEDRVPRRRGADLADRLGVPSTTLDDLLSDLRRAGLVTSHRGPNGGWSLAGDAADVTVADVIRGLEGPLADIRGIRVDELQLPDDEQAMKHMWIALRVQIRSVLEHVTIADLVANRLDGGIEALTHEPEAWRSRELRGAPPT